MRLGKLFLALLAAACAVTATAAPRWNTRQAVTAPFTDEFNGTAGTNLAGRTVGGVTYLTGSGTASHVQVDGSGHLNGNGSGSGTFITIAPPGMNEWWVTRYLAPNSAWASTGNVGASFGRDHWFTDKGLYNGFTVYCTCLPNTLTSFTVGAVRAASANTMNGAVTGSGTGTGSNIMLAPGDNLSTRYTYPGGVPSFSVYLNGDLVRSGFSQANSPLSNNGVFAPMRGDELNGLLDAIVIGDPKINGLISVRMPYHVLQLNPDGSITQTIDGDYSGPIPTGMAFSLKDTSTETIISGMTSVPLTSFTASAGHWSGVMSIPAAKVAAAMQIQVERTSGLVSGTSYAWSPVVRAGDVSGCTGQSLCQLMHNTATGVNVTARTTYYTVDGSPVGNSGVEMRIINPVASAIPAAFMEALDLQAGGPSAEQWHMTGNGATFLHDRLPGGSSGIWEAAVASWNKGGNNFQTYFDLSGHYEVQVEGTAGAMDPTNRTTFKADLVTQYGNMRTQVGHDFGYIVVPMGALSFASARDNKSMDLRRAQIEVIRANPTYYREGPPTWDLQHDGEIYHLANSLTGFGEQARRMAYSTAKYRGYVTCDRNGPMIEGVTRVDDHTVDVFLDMECATASAEVFEAASADHRLGFTFSIGDVGATMPCGSTGSTPCVNLAVPNALPVASNVSSGHDKVRFSFASGKFPLVSGGALPSVCVRGPWGQDPYARPWSGNNVLADYVDGNSTIDADIVNLAARVVANYGDSVGVKTAVRPYFNPSYTNDLTHDYLCAA
jgi:hypothetical protein